MVGQVRKHVKTKKSGNADVSVAAAGRKMKLKEIIANENLNTFFWELFSDKCKIRKFYALAFRCAKRVRRERER